MTFRRKSKTSYQWQNLRLSCFRLLAFGPGTGGERVSHMKGTGKLVVLGIQITNFGLT